MSLSSKFQQSIDTSLSANYLISILGLSCAYFLAGMLGLEMQSAQTGVTPFWPASGIVLAAFIIYGMHLWPAVFIGMISIAFTYNMPVYLALLSATGSVLEIIIPLIIVKKYGYNVLQLSRRSNFAMPVGYPLSGYFRTVDHHTDRFNYQHCL